MAGGRTRLRVRYAETDQMGVAHHASYFPWFEQARTDLMRQRGLAYRDLEAGGIRLPVIEAWCRYHAPARYDDELDVEVWVELLRPTRLAFGYRVWPAGAGAAAAGPQEAVDRASRRVAPLAEGRTVHAFTDARGRPVRLDRAQPEAWRRLQQVAGGDGPAP